MSVLIVDGYSEIIERLKDLISENDNKRTIYAASNFEHAISLLEKAKPKTVVLDINLPQNQSYKLLRHIKITNKNIVVIVLSIHIDDQTKNQCMELGADYFFDKYNEFDKIPGTIKLRTAG